MSWKFWKRKKNNLISPRIIIDVEPNSFVYRIDLPDGMDKWSSAQREVAAANLAFVIDTIVNDPVRTMTSLQSALINAGELKDEGFAKFVLYSLNKQVMGGDGLDKPPPNRRNPIVGPENVFVGGP